jgi:hypothetical protein
MAKEKLKLYEGVWEVLIKGEAVTEDSEDDDSEAGFEISLVRPDNKHGHDSWGWSGDDKIILFDYNGVCGSQTARFDEAVEFANRVCTMLNTSSLAYTRENLEAKLKSCKRELDDYDEETNRVCRELRKERKRIK